MAYPAYPAGGSPLPPTPATAAVDPLKLQALQALLQQYGPEILGAGAMGASLVPGPTGVAAGVPQALAQLGAGLGQPTSPEALRASFAGQVAQPGELSGGAAKFPGALARMLMNWAAPQGSLAATQLTPQAISQLAGPPMTRGEETALGNVVGGGLGALAAPFGLAGLAMGGIRNLRGMEGLRDLWGTPMAEALMMENLQGSGLAPEVLAAGADEIRNLNQLPFDEAMAKVPPQAMPELLTPQSAYGTGLVESAGNPYAAGSQVNPAAQYQHGVSVVPQEDLVSQELAAQLMPPQGPPSEAQELLAKRQMEHAASKAREPFGETSYGRPWQEQELMEPVGYGSGPAYQAQTMPIPGNKRDEVWITQTGTLSPVGGVPRTSPGFGTSGLYSDPGHPTFQEKIAVAGSGVGGLPRPERVPPALPEGALDPTTGRTVGPKATPDVEAEGYLTPETRREIAGDYEEAAAKGDVTAVPGSQVFKDVAKARQPAPKARLDELDKDGAIEELMGAQEPLGEWGDPPDYGHPTKAELERDRLEELALERREAEWHEAKAREERRIGLDHEAWLMSETKNWVKKNLPDSWDRLVQGSERGKVIPWENQEGAWVDIERMLGREPTDLEWEAILELAREHKEAGFVNIPKKKGRSRKPSAIMREAFRGQKKKK